MQREDIKFQSSTILEGMVSLRALLAAKEANINDRPIYKVLYDAERAPRMYRELEYLRRCAKVHEFLLQETPPEQIDAMALGTSHGGILAVCGDRTIPVLEASSIQDGAGFYVMIQGIEDPYNFGYALRSLYACGATGIVLPERNWFSAAGVVARSSAGASEMLPVYMAQAGTAVELFHHSGYRVVCADERTDHVLHETLLNRPLLLVIGGERRGISRAILEQADVLVRIPYGRTFRASLSAASAATILGYEILRQNQ